MDILSQADATEVTAEENEGAADAGTVVAEATARLRITETVTERYFLLRLLKMILSATLHQPIPVCSSFSNKLCSFVPIKDMKGMLQTGCFEGQRITYVNRKEKRVCGPV